MVKINKKTFNVVFIRFLSFNKYIKINLTSKIFNEQFSNLSFFLHFISTQQYSLCSNLSYPANGWITLDKEITDSEIQVGEFEYQYSGLLDFFKYCKKKVSYDLRCLKKVESDFKINNAVVKFIEDIACSDEDLFKRVQLRQLKRVFNQRKINCQFKLSNQPAIFHNLNDVFDFILKKIEIFSLPAQNDIDSINLLDELLYLD